MRLLFATLLLAALTLAAPSPSAAFEGPSSAAYLASDGSSLPFVSDDEVLDFLRHARVVGVKELSSGSTKPLRLDLELDGVRARAVFRSVDRRRERLRMRDGRAYAVFYDRAASEVAAYRLSRLLGLGMVPPAVLREYDGRQGSLQLWVERARTEQQRRDEGEQAPEPVRWLHLRSVMRTFDALVANADRNTGNSLVDEHWRLWMIDHTRAFQRPRGVPDLDAINHVPSEFLERLRRISAADLERELSPYLEAQQVSALEERRASLLAHVDRLIEERGRGAVVLDGPLPRSAESTDEAGAPRRSSGTGS